jgi:hypothetical protein
MLPCASLGSLAKVLLEKYDMRSDLMFRNRLAVETEIVLTNKLITNHRHSCCKCKQREKMLRLKPKGLSIASHFGTPTYRQTRRDESRLS